jgi:hypothetical protein
MEEDTSEAQDVSDEPEGGVGTPVRGGEADFRMSEKLFRTRISSRKMSYEKLAVMERWVKESRAGHQYMAIDTMYVTGFIGRTPTSSRGLPINSIELKACMDLVIDPAVEVLQVMATRDGGDATGVMFVKLVSAWDAGRYMMKFADVSSRGHEIKVQYASKEFPMEKLNQVMNGMLGRNIVIQRGEVLRWVNRRVNETRRQAYSQEVVSQFSEGQPSDWNDKGERVFDRGRVRERVMKLGTTIDSSLNVKYPLEGPDVNVVILPIGAPQMSMTDHKGKGEVKGKGKGKDKGKG